MSKKNKKSFSSVILSEQNYFGCISKTLKGTSYALRFSWMLNRFESAGKNYKKRQNYRFWEEGNDAQEIFLNDHFIQKLKSIHENPVKAKLYIGQKITKQFCY